MSLLLISAGVGLVAITCAVLTFLDLRKAPIQFPNMAEIASYIATGVRAYLSRQLRTILLVTPFLAAVVWALLGPWVALTFTLGILTSLITAFLGMSAAVRANEKTAEDATTSP